MRTDQRSYFTKAFIIYVVLEKKYQTSMGKSHLSPYTPKELTTSSRYNALLALSHTFMELKHVLKCRHASKFLTE